MGSVSRPLIALLVGTVAFFALWLTALKPGSSHNSSGSLGRYNSAITAAHQAVAASDAASVAHGGSVARPAAPAAGKASAATVVRPAVPAHSASKHAAPVRSSAVHRVATGATPGQRLNIVSSALRANKVIAVLFYNPAAADDEAVKQELAAVPTHRGSVVKLAVPITELSSYTIVTNQVPVNISPTLVLINRNHQASTIVGFADEFEIAQRVLDALAGT